MSTITTERRKLNDEIMQDIKEIKNILVGMQQAEAARLERESRIRDDVDGLKKCINGNGLPGLKTDVQLLKEQMTRVYWLAGMVIVASVGNIVAMWFDK